MALAPASGAPEVYYGVQVPEEIERSRRVDVYNRRLFWHRKPKRQRSRYVNGRMRSRKKNKDHGRFGYMWFARALRVPISRPMFHRLQVEKLLAVTVLKDRG